jgi:hypothetical protein
MKYNTQGDPRWAHDVMTEGVDQYNKRWIDTLGKSSTSMGVGCFVTAMANIEQERSGMEFLPSTLNDILRRHKGYFWLAKDAKNMIKYYGSKVEVSEKNASFLNMPVLEGIFLFKFQGWIKPILYKNEKDVHWVVRITTPWGGHYINLLYEDSKGKFVCFDTLTGQTRTFLKKEVTFIHKIKYLN